MNLDNEKELILEQSSSRTVVISAAGSGKALENGNLVYTENGPIKIEDCAVGQKIYGEDGKLHNILGVYPQGKKRKFIVQFTDKTEISCCEEHLWTFQTSSLRSKKSKKWITASLKDMIAEYPIFIKSSSSKKMNSTRRRNLFIPMTQPVEFPHKNIPLDPYTLGALLGDGHLNGAGKSSTFSNKDDDILERVIKGLEKIQCSLKKTSEDRFDYTIAQQGRTNIKGTFTKILEELKLDFTRSSTKFIPDIYKYNSTNIRLEVLRGLIDTDGYCDGSSYDIVLKSLRLILDIKEIVESLGLTATFQEKKAVCTNSANGKKDCGTVYRLRIKTSKSFPKLHFSKRREKQWKPTRVYSHRAINNIIETNDFVEMTCIKIDSPTELFLTSNFIVTHNTKLLTEKVRQVLKSDVDPSRIAVITFTNLASEELRKRLKDDYKEGLFIGTVHSLANQLLQKAGIQTKKYIDEDKFDELFRVVMENPFCLKKYEWVFLDEAQDSSGTQFEFLFEMLNPDNFFLVGDPRQSIYQWSGGNPQLIEGISKQWDVDRFEMTYNYRCREEILEFAKRILIPAKMEDNSIAVKGFGGLVHHLPYKLSSIYTLIDQKKDYGDWFVLARTNRQVDSIYGYLYERGVPVDTFKQRELNQALLAEKMATNTVKVLTAHSSKGLSSKKVIAVGMQYYSKEERRLGYVAATRAKDELYWMAINKNRFR